ncbi:AAA family ATPase [Alcanivorax sp.]|uniref:AAA family ATPase n=1 Tax=Alcanivorax sp. TaxID=1872427 RepID=UPI0025BC597A|nr:AAA family ATPase [Alcanivorax sp.]
MKLAKARIKEFRSINDSTEFEINDITCLVGKNESGKTAILRALYKLNPIIEEHGYFDVTDDYPRRDVSDYEEAVEDGEREPAVVVTATYELEREDVFAVEEIYGSECFSSRSPIVSLSKDYDNKLTFGELNLNQEKALQHLIKSTDLSATVSEEALSAGSVSEVCTIIEEAEKTDASQSLLRKIEPIKENGLRYVVYNDILRSRIPKFLYFDDYYQMKGQDNVEALQKRRAENTLIESDHPLLGLLSLAKLKLDELSDPKRTEALLSKLEAAENQLTSRVLKYWSQNQHIRLKFDIRPAQPEDPEGMRSGTNIWGRVVDTKHMVSTPLRTRSRGFVWFFSFLAWYSDLKRNKENLILLLDEPGLSLHAKAQADLLGYFESELRPHHQVVYSTHSPFLVDSTRFDRVRIVQDISVEKSDEIVPKEKEGTKVTTEILEATEDSLFPLQGALGYEIHQTLFVGPNNLVVEGVSDLLYLQTISSLLQESGEDGLSDQWTITPVGGSDKVSTFVSLIGSQRNLNVAVLVDYQKKDKQSIENIFKKKLLQKKFVLTYADFIDEDEADVEDMFNEGFYLKLVNKEYEINISVSDLRKGKGRVVKKVEEYLEKHPLPNGIKFNHYRPAKYFASKIGELKKDLSDSQIDRFRKVFGSLNDLI